jgi:hypothetical protein
MKNTPPNDMPDTSDPKIADPQSKNSLKNVTFEAGAVVKKKRGA